MTRVTATCLCGAVRIDCTVPKPEVEACHCRQCQIWTGGGPYYSVRIEDAEIAGEENVGTYRASAWAERAFCRTCGTNLFWRMQGRPLRSISAGLLPEQSALRVTEEIFVDRRPGWLPAWPDATQSTEAEQEAILDAFLKGEAP